MGNKRKAFRESERWRDRPYYKGGNVSAWPAWTLRGIAEKVEPREAPARRPPILQVALEYAGTRETLGVVRCLRCKWAVHGKDKNETSLRKALKEAGLNHRCDSKTLA